MVKEIKSKSSFKTFEHITCRVMCESGAMIFVNVYRRHYSVIHRHTVTEFLAEFSCFLSELNTLSTPITMVGDFNFHVEFVQRSDDFPSLTSNHEQRKNEAISFLQLLTDFSYIQKINEPTHDASGTLDLLILSQDNKTIESIEVGY